MTDAVEVGSPPVPQSILVFEGRMLTSAQLATLREQIDEAFRVGKWPILLNYDGPVYWLPVEHPALREFAEWVVDVGDDHISTPLADEIITKAREALEKASP